MNEPESTAEGDSMRVNVHVYVCDALHACGCECVCLPFVGAREACVSVCACVCVRLCKCMQPCSVNVRTEQSIGSNKQTNKLSFKCIAGCTHSERECARAENHELLCYPSLPQGRAAGCTHSERECARAENHELPCYPSLPQGRTAGCTHSERECARAENHDFPCYLGLPQRRTAGCTHSEREGQQGTHVEGG